MKSLIPYKPSVIRAAVQDALACAESAVMKAIHAGQMLIEIKASLERGQWLTWLTANCPELSEDRAQRWMLAATKTALSAGIQTNSFSLPWSQVLALPAAELPEAERKAQQLFLDFTQNKTLKDCMAGVMVEGDEPHRITRAANGKLLGGSHGEDRKDWPKFVGEKLSDVTSHLGHKLSAAQRTAVGASFDAAMRRWPRWLVELVGEYARREMKLSEEDRAGRGGAK